MSLEDYGLVPFFTQQASRDEVENGRVRRVTEVQRSLIRVTNGAEECSIQLDPSWRSLPLEQCPTVGDWVVLDERLSRIDRILERKSVFRRFAAGDKADIQLIASNIDILFVVTSCNEEFKESRLERYLALAAEAGLMPVVVLTKIDLCDDPDLFVERACGVRPGLAVEAINALDSSTCGGVTAWIERGSTIALVGSSGVGKSSLLNSLVGEAVAATGGVREDDQKGRHTTTFRALHVLPGGGLLIDVPGMRELRIFGVDSGLAAVFEDIEAIALNCRFSNCGHESEPECAVRTAVETGTIDARRVRNYLKLLRENKRNSSSIAETRSRNRALGKLYKQIQGIKQDQRSH